MATYESPFALHQKVHLDGDVHVRMTVTAVLWRAATPQVELSWFNGGSLISAWVDPDRVRPVPGQEDKS